MLPPDTGSPSSAGRPAITTVGVNEARTRFADLLRRVEAGETVRITRRGEVVAELRGAVPARRRPAGALAWTLPDRAALLATLAPDPDLEADFYAH